MNKSEFRSLIREELKKTLNESLHDQAIKGIVGKTIKMAKQEQNDSRTVVIQFSDGSTLHINGMLVNMELK